MKTTFVIEWRNSGGTAPVATAIEQVQRLASAADRSVIPLVAVPFMGPTGQRRCEDAGVAWLDLSGNAQIVAPGIRVRIDGQPNRYKRPGRRSSAFAPKSARIARWLLMHPHQPTMQQEIAQATGMDKGFTSRILARLEEDGLIVRGPDGAIGLQDPDLLLDAWHEEHDFAKHQIISGHVPARSGADLLRKLAGELRDGLVQYAATGLAAAWLLTRFAGFRLVTIYVAEHPAPRILNRLGFREEERGANVRLVLPKDEGVFHGVVDRDGVACVHPVQVYLDLKSQPERAKEAAEHLRSELLKWGADD
ncbi:MAG: type IV toxin-antitoxin system AbiEi family antitoxin [Candidatus Krumholzibacteriia bacterium]